MDCQLFMQLNGWGGNGVCIKLVLDQLTIPLVIFLLILITCLIDIVLMTILSGEILFVHARELREWRTHTAKNSSDKGGIDLLAILMDYFSPSKHDFGEIHLHFKMTDKQFFTCIKNMAAFILTQNYEKDNGIFQVSHKIYCSWAIISDLRQVFILKSRSRFIQWNYKIWGKETANICEIFGHSASIFFCWIWTW